MFQTVMWGSRAEKKKTGLMPQERHMGALKILTDNGMCFITDLRMAPITVGRHVPNRFELNLTAVFIK